MCEYSLSPELARARTGFAPDPGAGSVKPIAASPDDLELRGHPLAPPCEIGARFRSPQPTSHDNRLATPFAEPSQETPHRQLTASAKSDSHARGRWFDPSRAHFFGHCANRGCDEPVGREDLGSAVDAQLVDQQS